MVIYFIMIILSVFFAYQADKVNQNKNKDNYKKKRQKYIFLCILSFIFPFLVSGFRDFSIGTDTSGTYYDIFDMIKNDNLRYVRDKGYGIITQIAYVLFHNYTGALTLTSLITCGIAYYCIFRDSKYPVMSTLLFFTTNVYFISMNMIRQCIATMIFIFSIIFIKKKKLLPYLLLSALAISMHTSAVVYIPFYFILNKKLDKKLSVITILIFILFGGAITDAAMNLLFKIDYFNNYFSWYMDSSYNSGEFNLISFGIALCIYLFLLFINKKAKNDYNYNILFWLQTLVICILSLSSKLPLMQRTSWLLAFPLFIYLPGMFDYIENKKLKLITKICVNAGYIAYMIVTSFMLGYNEIYPYVSIFS